ncbi:MAG: type II toxin-antitoxin system VapC family toxin [Pyrinomonadaceae bacterium]
MRLLLDTQVYLWVLLGSRKLSQKARDLITNASEVYVSAASIWEASIKISTGKLSIQKEILLEGITKSGFAALPVQVEHAARVAMLPNHHRDPFDRLLIAQAILETLRLLTADDFLSHYSELVVQVHK